MKTRKEQIAEMAKAMGDFELKDTVKCDIELSEHLFEKGYRKQSDTVREFVGKLDKDWIEVQTKEYGRFYAVSEERIMELATEYGAEVEE